MLPLLLTVLAAQDPAPARVFLLAGQSNMVGYTSAAWVTEHAPTLATPRDDVWCLWQRTCSPLAPGRGHDVGPELALGHALGEHFEEPVLLAKFAWGGTTLKEAWRPPSAVDARGGEIGHLFKSTLKGLHRALARPELTCPDALAGRGFEVAGFVWLQGENDCFDGREAEYAANLTDLIADVRTLTGTPDLPVVVVQINDSGAWDEGGGGGPQVRAAQAAVAAADPRVGLVITRDLDEGYHYADGDHVTIGRRAGVEMLALLERAAPTDTAALAAARATLEELFYPGRAPRPPRPDVHLSDVTWTTAESGWGDGPQRDRSIDGNPLSVDGEAFARGVGTHAVSRIVVPLEPRYARFVAVAGIDDEMGGRTVCSVTFHVLVDGEAVAESVVVKSQERWYFDVPLPAGARELELRVDEADSGKNSDHADWVDAGFVLRAGR